MILQGDNYGIRKRKRHYDAMKTMLFQRNSGVFVIKIRSDYFAVSVTT